MIKKKQRIVVLGCGFGGLTLVKLLNRFNIEILVIDRNNYHTFQPLLYQVGTGGLEAENIVYPIRRIIRKYKNITFRRAEILSVDTVLKKVNTNIGKIDFDYLVVAQGSTNNFLNFEKIKDKILPLKSLTDAFNIRSSVMQNLERALETKNPDEQEEIINIAIIGGGPAGIEVAGALAEMKRYVIPKDFPELNLKRMHINLFEASQLLLSAMSTKASLYAFKYLKNLGVNVYLHTRVKNYNGHSLILENGETFNTDTVIWTAGVKPVYLNGLSESSYLPGGRIKVDEFNRVIGYENIFAIGDNAAFVSKENPKGLPMLAPVAIQQAKHLTRNLINMLNNKPFEPFRYKDKGTMATIGRKKAVVDFPNWKFQGYIAWFVWMFVHIMSLIGFRNKLVTMINWMVSYFNYDKPLGIIIPVFNNSKLEN